MAGCRAGELLAAKSLTISKLLVLAPPGTIDPTPHIYDTTMYGLAGLMAIAAISHSLVRPTVAAITLPAAKVEAGPVPEEPVVEKKLT